jgi:hypothetical protein
MGIEAVAAVSSSAVSSAVNPAQSALAAVTSGVAAALQEANETPAVTQKEAASGDRQAIRLLAKHSHVDHMA